MQHLKRPSNLKGKKKLMTSKNQFANMYMAFMVMDVALKRQTLIIMGPNFSHYLFFFSHQPPSFVQPPIPLSLLKHPSSPFPLPFSFLPLSPFLVILLIGNHHPSTYHYPFVATKCYRRVKDSIAGSYYICFVLSYILCALFSPLVFATYRKNFM